MKIENRLAFVIITLIVSIVGVTICLVFYSNQIELQNNENKIVQEECEQEHEWVITSKYDFWRNTYRTISKCSKCGKEIE